MAITAGGYNQVFFGTVTQDLSGNWIFTANDPDSDGLPNDLANVGIGLGANTGSDGAADYGRGTFFFNGPTNSNFTTAIPGFSNIPFAVLATATPATGPEWYLGESIDGTGTGTGTYVLITNSTVPFNQAFTNLQFTLAPLVDNPDTVCFLEGTRILTRAGYWPVESLEAGDEVMTLNHGWQPVRWLGHRNVQPQPVGGFAFKELPIRISRDAFGAGLPVRDLWVSPEHGVFFRDHLIPAKHLVNGSTVTRDAEIGRIVYYHVLLERHSVVFSEALPTESYVPSDNEAFFQNADSIPAELTDAIHCRIGPMVTDCYPRTTSGPVVETARAYLAEHAPASELRQVA
jgi:hypothetical protein